ncbi:hypothetical protein, partial [Arthrobacter sp. JCM 19049]|uniref:hypothetical protein n=1 Tax=Arthrobacter sp. JCM 19049 TaxID=1460643 RepID=UPI002436419E
MIDLAPLRRRRQPGNWQCSSRNCTNSCNAAGGRYRVRPTSIGAPSHGSVSTRAKDGACRANANATGAG